MLNQTVPVHVLEAFESASPEIKRRYLAAGGTEGDFRTDLSDALAGALTAWQDWLA